MSKTRNTTIIIHSKLSYGYVGCNTTSFVLQMNSQDVITVPTVLYSNHLSLATVGGGIVPAPLFSELLEGILKLNILSEVSTIITGYIGSSEQVKITADFIDTVKNKHPEIIYLCDPVMGDMDRNLYVPKDVPQAIIQYLIPLADILTPNQFEFEQIIGKPMHSIKNLTELYQEYSILPHQQLVVTGCRLKNTPTRIIENIVIRNGEYEIINVTQINTNPPGTGELFTAHLHLLFLKDIVFNDAVTQCVRILKVVLQKMLEENRHEFKLTDIMFSMNSKVKSQKQEKLNKLSKKSLNYDEYI